MAVSANRNTGKRTTPGHIPDQSPVDISIPGVNNLLGQQNQSSVWRRIFWAVAILVCTILCVLQIGQRIAQYLSDPISVNVDVLLKTEVSFPAVTICPFYPFSFNRNINELRDQYAALYNTTHNVITYWNDSNSIHFLDLLDLPGVNVTLLWQMGGMSKDDVEIHRACQFQTKKNCDVPIDVKEMPTYIGTCIKLSFSNYKLIFDGAYNGMELKIYKHGSDSSYWQHMMVLHHSKEHATRFLHSNRAQPMHPFREITVSFSIKEYRRANTRSNPCAHADVVRRCIGECLRTLAEEKVACKLPYMIPSVNLPWCNSSASAKQAYNITVNAYAVVTRRCSYCRRSCVEKHYAMSQDVVMAKNCTWPKILMVDNRVEVIRESVSYTLGMLISDIGGSLGLFLGACILTGLQVLESFAMHVVNKVRQRKLY